MIRKQGEPGHREKQENQADMKKEEIRKHVSQKG